MKIIASILIGLFLAFCSERQELLERIKQSGELRVAVRNSLATCYRTGDGFAGLEYTLAKRFADGLGTGLKMILVENDREAVEAVERGDAHLAAGIGTDSKRNASLRFGPVYQQVSRKVVYRRKGKRPRNLRSLAGRLVEVAAGQGHAEMLRELAREYPDIIWRERPRSLATTDLLSLVLEQEVELTIADANEMALFRQRYPELSTAFSIGEPRSLAWGIPSDADDNFYMKILLFFKGMKKSGKLDSIIEQHYGHADSFDYVEIHKFLRRTKDRLPKYIEYFKQAATENGLDWRLLSAMGYQESHWNPKAVSPTGVRGIMMLTIKTARQLGIADRTDERDSIFGGARYFAQLRKRIPRQIEEPDRTWLALAAYNVGYGHLQDARILTRKGGGNPDRWRDIRKYLPLLSQRKWYTKTKHGRARGYEPVQYVRNIRRYYDRLVWLDSTEDG